MGISPVPRMRPAGPGMRRWITALATATQPERQQVAVDEFEKAFARWLGVKQAVAVPSARYGMLRTMEHLGVKAPARVALSGFNARVLPDAIRLAGATPLFLPADRNSLNVHFGALEREAAAGSFSLLVVTHLEGLPVDLDRVAALAERYGFPWVEDCAHALGARYRGRLVGTFGRAGIFSFGLGKHLNALGGGMVVTGDDALAGALRSGARSLEPLGLRGMAPRFALLLATVAATRPGVFPWLLLPALRAAARWDIDPIRWALDDRPGEFSQGAMSRLAMFNSAQALAAGDLLARLDEGLAARRRLALQLTEAFSERGTPTPSIPVGSEPAYLVYPLVVDQPGPVRRRLLAAGVDAQLTWMHCIEHDRETPGCAACRLAAGTLYLPTYPEMSEGERRTLLSAAEGIGEGAG